MCGIAGIWHFDSEPVTEHKIARFTDSLAHRGPDGFGYWIDTRARLALGHRRLSILDLSVMGKQPMSFANERYWITYNGEIFNFIELRHELINLGYTFKTDTDTEIILAAYHKWGHDCQYKFNGMWAFAIWDSQKQVLFLSRDRYGIKPLLYTYIPGKLFALASETNAFASLQGFDRSIDQQLLVRNMLSPTSIQASGYSIYKNIFALKSGCCMLLSSNSKPIQKRWWNTVDHLVKTPDTYEEKVEVFKDLFKDSCRIRLRSDVPVATSLSGGVDSSSVFCMINSILADEKSAGGRISIKCNKAFVASFPNSSIDETAFAKEVIDYTKGEVSYLTFDTDTLLSDIETVTRNFDTVSTTPMFVVSEVYRKMREQGYLISMDGHGADELMFGYKSSVAEVYLEFMLNDDKISGDETLDVYLNMFSPADRERAKNAISERLKRVRGFENKHESGVFKKGLKVIAKKMLFGNKYTYFKAQMATEWFNYVKLDPLDELEDKPHDFRNLSRARQKQADEFHITDIPYNMRDFDKASMMHGVEVRMPFMDWRLVSFLFSLNLKTKIGAGYNKRILRDSMKGIMPESIRTRKSKIGFGAPLNDWFNNQLAEYLMDTVHSGKFLNSSYWNAPLLKKYVISRTKNKSWTIEEAHLFWYVLSANIIL